MKIVQVKIANFRGIVQGTIHFDGHSVLVGDNNAGKSTLLEAIDLVLGPERLSRRPAIDEHDFYAGQYLNAEGLPIPLSVEVIVADLNEEQLRHFREHLEWWDANANKLLAGPPVEGTDAAGVGPALRVFFRGAYDAEEDDFLGNTFFALPVPIGASEPQAFRASDKRKCGFLYLRTVRTGSRALSMERGSLLDVILRLQDSRLKIWEELLGALRTLPVAEKPELGVTTLLAAVQTSVKKFVPSDWAEDPHLRVSDLTRETLRRTLTVFMGTGARRPDGSSYAAPYQHQGTGTINTLVLALLSIIAELKQNVIFAMEEPETALPPHTQKRIINSVREKSAQALFTSHSPYVLEEFEPAQIKALKRAGGVMTSVSASLPPTIKPKAYKSEFRARFCEALLAKYVLIVEGRTEFDALPAAARTLSKTDPQYFKSLEALGVAVIDAKTDSQIAPLGHFFKDMGKTVFAVFDKQDEAQLTFIRGAVDFPYESPMSGFESLVLQGTNENAIRRYALSVVTEGDWPRHLVHVTPTADSDLVALRNALSQYFAWGKGSGQAADLLASCTGWQEMPKYVTDCLHAMFRVIEPPPASASAPAPAPPPLPLPPLPMPPPLSPPVEPPAA